MTPSPTFLAPDATLSHAKRLMDELLIRHLPVLLEGKLVGVLSDRDLTLVERLAHAPRDAIRVEDAMMTDPFAVGPDTPVDVVAREMAGRKIGSAIVIEHGAVVGVFTTTDALRALAAALGGDVPRPAWL